MGNENNSWTIWPHILFNPKSQQNADFPENQFTQHELCDHDDKIQADARVHAVVQPLIRHSCGIPTLRHLKRNTILEIRQGSWF
jgi:hypothetical protein